MLSSEYNSSNFDDALQQVKLIKDNYSDFGGVFVWEYFQAPPEGLKYPEVWANKMYAAINERTYCEYINNYVKSYFIKK